MGTLGSVASTPTTEPVPTAVRSRVHLAEVFDCGGIGDAVPIGFSVVEEVVEGVGVGLGFEEEVGGHGIDGMRGSRGRGIVTFAVAGSALTVY
jgi:hypothetical protein